MAVLIEQDRLEIWSSYMRDSSVGAMAALTKPQLRAAVDAADDWANSNATAFNSALPVAARNALTGPQKALLLSYVINKRWQAGS